MLKPIKTRYYLTLLQMIGLLFLLGVLLLLNKEVVVDFFYKTGAGQVGLVLDGIILTIFLVGLLRMVVIFLSYMREQDVLQQFLQRMTEGAMNPAYNLPASSLIVGRYQAVQTIARQQAAVNQSALAASLSARQSSELTLIRFVHNILIISGVFGTALSLSVALMGMAGLLDSPENLQKMGSVISGMSNALSTTIVAIVCYIFFTYFHMRLQDARTQLLVNIEDTTTLYILPRFKHAEGSMLHDVAVLTAELKTAAETLNRVQDRFLQAGERLQLAVDDLQNNVGQSGENIRIIRDSIREGFRLDKKG